MMKKIDALSDTVFLLTSAAVVLNWPTGSSYGWSLEFLPPPGPPQ